MRIGPSSPSWLAVAAFGFATLLLLWGAAFRTIDGAEAYDPYVAGVRAMVEAQWFKVGRREGRTVIEPRPEFRARLAAPSLERLQQDLGNLELWTVEHGQVRDFHGLRSVAGPFDSTSSWNGSLAYARPLIGPDVIELTRVEGVGPSISLTYEPDFAVGRGGFRHQVDLTAPLRQAPPPTTLILVRCGRGPESALLLYRIGDEVVANARGADACHIEVSANRQWRRLVRGCRDRSIARDACQFAPLLAGDQLRILSPADGRVVSRYQRRINSASGSAVLHRLLDGNALADPVLGPFAGAVAEDLRAAMRGCTGLRVAIPCSEDITLSLDEELQRSSYNVLQPVVGTRPTLGAVTIMNSATGEVLAMAGVVPPDQQRWCSFAPLCALPVGSTAKPIFAAAILSADSTLRNLVVRETPRDATRVLGLRLGRTLHNTHSSSQPVSFEEFLKHSDNYYAASLLLLASPAANAQGARCRSDIDYRLSGDWLSDRPRSAFEGDACRTFGAETAPQSFRPAWAMSLMQLFDVNPWGVESLPRDICTSSGWVYFGDDYRDASPWAGLFSPGANRCAMPRSSPARLWFGIDEAANFGTDLVPLILGDGNGRWSTVKLAEAFSRIVTGREIRATFLSRRHTVETGRADPESLADFERAHRAVTAGMAQVFDGTALPYSLLQTELLALQQRVPTGYVLGAFAKTGTMQVPPQSLTSCPGGRIENCSGSSFAIVLGIYGASTPRDPATGRAAFAPLTRPNCAITVVINLPAYPSGRAGNLAGALIRDGVAGRLVNRRGEVCDGLS